MVLAEIGTIAHGYLFIAGVIMLIMFLSYVYLYDHKTFIEGHDMWEKAFLKVGTDKNKIQDITHDDNMWYYKGVSTCVAHSGDFSGLCHRYENYCSGGDRYGDDISQAKAVKEALEDGGEHPMCPLIYSGAD